MAPRKPSLLVSRLEAVPDPRRPGGNLRHPLVNVLVLAFSGVVAGCQDFEEVVEYARSKSELWPQFLDLSRGIPSADTFERVFARICPQALQAALVGWLQEVRRLAGGEDSDGPEVVAIDGKTLRRSFDSGTGLGALHLVSAWATESHLTLGQVAVDEKSNEITAIPALLDLLELTGTVVTIDAAGCQKEIAETIVQKKGDYLLALKANHPTLSDAVQRLFLDELERRRRWPAHRRHSTTETGHGRRDRREVYVLPVPDDLEGREAWAGLQSVIMVLRESTRRTTGQTSGQVRYFLSSLPPQAGTLAHIARAHWGIENGLHWVLDVVFSEDHSRLRRDNAPQNWALLRRLAVSLIKNESTTKGSIKCKRKRAGWNNEYLLQLLTCLP